MISITWKGILYDSLEHLRFQESSEKITVESNITGSFQKKNYTAKYSVELSRDWSVSNFHIAFKVNDDHKEITGTKGNNDWSVNGAPDQRFRGILFIDISLSPFTNTLPINNLDLDVGEDREISVIYIDVLEGILRPAQQRYRRLANNIYRYENVSNDFEADIVVDENGLVLFYPGLFERNE